MQWYNALSRRDRRLVAGLAVLTASQFLTWEHGSGATIAMAGIGSGAPVFSSVATGSGPDVIGWKVHPLALLAFPALFWTYASHAKNSPLWRRWGTWITLVVMLRFAWPDGVAGDAAFGVLVAWVGVAIAASSLRLKASPPAPGADPAR